MTNHDLENRPAYNRFIVENTIKDRKKTHPVQHSPIDVLVAGGSAMQLQLLTAALRRRQEFNVFSCSNLEEMLLQAITSSSPDVLVFATNGTNRNCDDMALLRRLHVAYPKVVQILLVESVDRELVVNAFRSGVRGLFCFGDYPFRLLCKCIQVVHQGQIWANAQQIDYLLGSVAQVPSLRVLSTTGNSLLTPREEQVVALVAEGLANKEIAQELALSEHTVKKYLFRIFDKLGISTRVELVLYTVNRGEHRAAEWLVGRA